MLDIRRINGKLFTTVYHNPDGSVFISADRGWIKDQIQRLEFDPQISNVFSIAIKKVKLT